MLFMFVKLPAAMEMPTPPSPAWFSAPEPPLPPAPNGSVKLSKSTLE
jgi:hypothetical protein